MARLLSDQQIRDVLTIAEAMEVMRTVLLEGPPVQQIAAPPRPQAIGTRHVETSEPGPPEIAALRSVLSSEAGVRNCVLLYSLATGELLAILEAGWLGQLGCAAAAGLATRHLTRDEAAVAGVFGSGAQAEAQLLAASAVRDLSLVKVFSRDRERLHGFCSRMSARVRAEVVPMSHVDAVVDGSDIIITATTSAEALFAGSLLSTGAHVNAVGAKTASRRELDATAISRADLIVVDSTDAARKGAGDLLLAAQEGVDPWSKTVELSIILKGDHPGRSHFDDITLFKPVGAPPADLALAARALSLAERAGIGDAVRIPG